MLVMDWHPDFANALLLLFDGLPPYAPGPYGIVLGGGAFQATFTAGDDPARAADGTVNVTHVGPDRVAGSYDLELEGGESLYGTFDAAIETTRTNP